MRAVRQRTVIGVAILGAAALALVVLSRQGDGGVTCDRTLETGGLAAFAASLRPGETGCLTGTVAADNTDLRALGGEPGRPVTITSAPGGIATIRGRIVLHEDVHDLVLRDLRFDGRSTRSGSRSLQLDGDRITLALVDVTNEHSDGSCIGIGHLGEGGGLAEDVTIERSRIHDCGALPPTNLDHGIYVEHARRTTIRESWIDGNASRGIQLYPDADETLVERNVLRGNGEGIIVSGANGLRSERNAIEGNVLAGARVEDRYLLESGFEEGAPPSSGATVFRDNCVEGPLQPELELRDGGGNEVGASGCEDPVGLADVGPRS